MNSYKSEAKKIMCNNFTLQKAIEKSPISLSQYWKR